MLYDKRGFMDIIKFINQLTLRWGDYLELSKWAQCKLHEPLKTEETGRRRSQRYLKC